MCRRACAHGAAVLSSPHFFFSSSSSSSLLLLLLLCVCFLCLLHFLPIPSSLLLSPSSSLAAQLPQLRPKRMGESAWRMGESAWRMCCCLRCPPSACAFARGFRVCAADHPTHTSPLHPVDGGSFFLFLFFSCFFPHPRLLSPSFLLISSLLSFPSQEQHRQLSSVWQGGL